MNIKKILLIYVIFEISLYKNVKAQTFSPGIELSSNICLLSYKDLKNANNIDSIYNPTKPGWALGLSGSFQPFRKLPFEISSGVNLKSYYSELKYNTIQINSMKTYQLKYRFYETTKSFNIPITIGYTVLKLYSVSAGVTYSHLQNYKTNYTVPLNFQPNTYYSSSLTKKTNDNRNYVNAINSWYLKFKLSYKYKVSKKINCYPFISYEIQSFRRGRNVEFRGLFPFFLQDRFISIGLTIKYEKK